MSRRWGAATVAVLVAVGAVGCAGAVKPQEVPDDLCAVIGDPSPVSLVPNGRAYPVTWRWKRDNQARCNVRATAGPNLQIDLRRFGGDGLVRKGAGPEERAERAYNAARREDPASWRCRRESIRPSRGKGFSCGRPADPATNTYGFVSVGVQVKGDFIRAELEGRHVDPAAGAAVLLRQIEQILDFLAGEPGAPAKESLTAAGTNFGRRDARNASPPGIGPLTPVRWTSCQV